MTRVLHFLLIKVKYSYYYFAIIKELLLIIFL